MWKRLGGPENGSGAVLVPTVAERVGFEPTMRLPPYRFSSAIPSVLARPVSYVSVPMF